MNYNQRDKETTRACNAIDSWDIVKEMLDAQRAYHRFNAIGNQDVALFFAMYYWKLRRRVREVV